MRLLLYTQVGGMSMAQTSQKIRMEWENANYKKYIVRLRVDTDQELIDFVEANKEKHGTTGIFRAALEKVKNEGL